MSIEAVIGWADVRDDAVVADVRWYLDGRDARAAFRHGHVPGAVFVDLDTALAAHGLDPTAGRHPLPQPADFAAAMAALGIGDDTTVVAYDDTGGMTAGRLVVMLRMLGCDAALADGGLSTYPGALEAGNGSRRAPATFTARPWPSDRLADADQAAAVGLAEDGRLLDARARDRFTGAVVAIDPRPGHIPGAISAPWSAVLDADDATFAKPRDLARYYRELGIDDQTDVVVSCGSGVSACVNALAMERAGLPSPRLYVGSFSGWSADPARAVATGEG
ncbi:MAG: sulfurtransferase [Desertimonas sp.]